jgi:polyphosphate kinase 2 (PPK2 family)
VSRVLVIVEGADGAGKTTLVARAIARLAPRPCRRVALGPPTDRERTQWYFQRWIAHLPGAGEIVFFDRSWYNRAALEPVHGLCTPAESEAFFAAVPRVERLLADDGIQIVRLLLEISPAEQARRLAARAHPTAIDRAAPSRWEATRAAHDRMIARTGPWIVVAEGDDPLAALSAALLRGVAQPDGGAGTGGRQASRSDQEGAL